jgi:hypothetical protein
MISLRGLNGNLLCPLLARRDISRWCSNSVAFGAKRTFSKPPRP